MPNYKLILRTLIAVLLCGILLSFVDWKQAAHLLLDLNILVAVCAILLLCAGLFISALKWQLLMKALDVQVPLIELSRLYWAASFFQNFLPSSVGGDIVRLTVMRKTQRLAKVAASIFVERLTGFIILLALAFLAFIIRPQYFYLVNKGAVVWFFLVVVIIAILVFLYFGREIASFIADRITGKSVLLRSIFAKFEKLMLSIGLYREKKHAVVMTLLISLVFYALIALFQYLTFASLGIEVPFKEVILIAPIIPLISLLPISLNGIGIAEGAFVILYSQLGISPEEALAAALLRRILLLLFSLYGGVFILQGKVTPKVEPI